MISTRDLSGLPAIPQLKALTQALAMLDAILCPVWEYRYYSFNAHWADGEAMASMRNGSGDEYFLLFTPAGAILKGFAHEYPMTPYRTSPPQVWPGILDAVPAVFRSFLTEPAFNIEATTFCIWREHGDASWRRGPIAFPAGKDPDGSAYLLAILDGDPQTYWVWAADYYEQPVSLAAVRAVYRHQPLTHDLVATLNPAMTLGDLASDAAEIDYPVLDLIHPTEPLA